MSDKPNRKPRRNLLSRSEAWQLLEPIAPQLYSWLQDSWEWVQAILDEDPERRSVLDPSTIAGMVYDRFKTLLKSGLHDNPSIEFVDHGRMTRALVGGKAILRFKKFDEQLRSRNIGTKNQESICHQQYYLDGVPARPTNITFGYVTDLAGASLQAVYFTCPDGWDSNHWIIKVGGAEEDGALLFDPHGFDDAPDELRLGSKKKTGKQA